MSRREQHESWRQGVRERMDVTPVRSVVSDSPAKSPDPDVDSRVVPHQSKAPALHRGSPGVKETSLRNVHRVPPPSSIALNLKTSTNCRSTPTKHAAPTISGEETARQLDLIDDSSLSERLRQEWATRYQHERQRADKAEGSIQQLRQEMAIAQSEAQLRTRAMQEYILSLESRLQTRKQAPEPLSGDSSGEAVSTLQRSLDIERRRNRELEHLIADLTAELKQRSIAIEEEKAKLRTATEQLISIQQRSESAAGEKGPPSKTQRSPPRVARPVGSADSRRSSRSITPTAPHATRVSPRLRSATPPPVDGRRPSSPPVRSTSAASRTGSPLNGPRCVSPAEQRARLAHASFLRQTASSAKRAELTAGGAPRPRLTGTAIAVASRKTAIISSAPPGDDILP
jgi:hypothetical protein